MFSKLKPLIQYCREQEVKAKVVANTSIKDINDMIDNGQKPSHKKSCSVSQYRIQNNFVEQGHLQEANKKVQGNKKIINNTMMHHKQNSVVPAVSNKIKLTSPTLDEFLFKSDDINKLNKNFVSVQQTAGGQAKEITTQHHISQQKLVGKTAVKCRHERTKSDCPLSNKKAENSEPQAHVNSKQLLSLSKGMIRHEDSHCESKKKADGSNQTSQKLDFLTTPSSPAKKKQSQERLHAQLKKMGKDENRSSSRKENNHRDVVDEEQKASRPHDGAQKVAGWHKRSASDGNAIAAKLEKMKGNAGNLRQEEKNIKKPYLDLAARKLNESKVQDPYKNANGIDSRCLSNAENYTKMKISGITNKDQKSTFKQFHGVKLDFDSSLSEDKRINKGNEIQFSKIETKLGKENNESEGKKSKYHMYDLLSKQNGKIQKIEDTKINNYFTNPKDEVYSCEVVEPKHAKKQQECTIISPHPQVSGAYGSSKKVPFSAAVSKGVSAIQSPEKERKDESKFVKAIPSCTKSASKPILMQNVKENNKIKYPSTTKKTIPQAQPAVKEICPLSIANVERLGQEGDISNLIQKISNRIVFFFIFDRIFTNRGSTSYFSRIL